MVENRYNFVDIYIFGKADNGSYVSLTDWYLGEGQSSLSFTADSPFLIGFSTYRGRTYYIAEITLEELQVLAGITPNTNFVKQIKSGIDEKQGNILLAILCSQKIVNYSFGKCIKEEDEEVIFNFKRRALENGKRVMCTVLTKTMRREMV